MTASPAIPDTLNIDIGWLHIEAVRPLAIVAVVLIVIRFLVSRHFERR
jgi:hypothetical protein